MLWARVIRGTSSREKARTFRSASEAITSGSLSGSQLAIKIWSSRNNSRSARPTSGFAPAARTCTITSARANKSARLSARTAPFCT
jgi:hypothetical protein